ncbi:MAG: 1-acyl-sn-glycerol-3-phosphate acyltransferase, partial [Lentisphaeria bacterium]|nr:1-acyl-sn-glycerol-3-phosphate acyltransferase [Lentisphaeria bacterium]
MLIGEIFFLVLAFFACGCALCSPYYVLKFFAFLLRCTFIRLRTYGIENLPKSGPVLLVSNHISMIDMVLIQAVAPRRVRFMVRTSVIDFLPTRFIFKLLGVISVPSARHPKAMMNFFDEIKSRLAKGEMVCIFPEGAISGNGNIMRFRSGVSHLLPEGVESSVIPVRIGMLRGRLFSIHQGKLRFALPYTWPVDISIAVGVPVDPNLSGFMLRQRISELGADVEMGPQPGELPIHTAFIKQAKCHPFRKIFVDSERGALSNFEMLIRAILISRKVRELNKGGVHVGVLLPNSTTASSVTLGVLMADRTPAMINYSLGQDVALDSCQRAGIKTILTSRMFLEKIKWEATPEMICLEDVAPSITKADKRKAIFTALRLPWRSLARKIAPLSCFNLRHQAVLLFSSGSTGKPKAVMLTHRNLNCDIYAFIRVIAWTPQDRIAGNL